MKDVGTGVSDGFNLNFSFAKSNPPKFYSIELAPQSLESSKQESDMDILEIFPGETYVHCNM
jgi:hypothetical protein